MLILFENKNTSDVIEFNIIFLILFSLSTLLKAIFKFSQIAFRSQISQFIKISCSCLFSLYQTISISSFLNLQLAIFIL